MEFTLAGQKKAAAEAKAKEEAEAEKNALPIDVEQHDGHAKLYRLQTQAAMESNRYEDMVGYVTQLAELNKQPHEETRNMIAVAYKNVVGPLRDAWFLLAATRHPKPALAWAVDQQKQKVASELISWCQQLVKLITTHLLKVDKQPVGQLFFLKLAADFSRYHAEVLTADAKEEKVLQAERFYNLAFQAAINNGIPPTHIVRLGLALNHSSFLIDVCDRMSEGVRVAKDAFESALPLVTSLKNPEYGDACHIMALLHDNLKTWGEDSDSDDDAAELMATIHSVGAASTGAGAGAGAGNKK